MFHDHAPGFAGVLNWEGSHLLLTGILDDHVVVVANLFGRFPLVVNAGPADEGWATGIKPGIENSLVWVLAPSLRRYAGPLSFGQFLSAKTGGGSTVLDDLRGRLQALPPRPSYD